MADETLAGLGILIVEDETLLRKQLAAQLERLVELLRGDGTLYYVETIYGTNFPPLEFYRATLVP
jgi:hypothetical protein